MRVLQINSAADWGGGEAHTLLLSQGLRALGCDVTLACRPGSVIAQRFQQQDLPTLPLPLRGELDVFSAWQLAQFCLREKIDVLHAHLARDYPLAALATCLAPHVRLVATRHVLFPLRLVLLQQFVVKRTQAFIAVSNAVKAVLVEHSGITAERVTTIYNGIDVDRFATAPAGLLRAELAFAPETPLIGVVCQIAPHKGLETFIRALPAIIADHSQARFVIVGGIQYMQYAEELRALAYELGVADYLRFLGQRDDIPQIMQDLTLLVVPSLGEAFGLVLVEAMAAGTPVIATNTGGALEIVRDRENGLLIPLHDPEALACAVHELLAHPQTAATYAETGRQRALTQFSCTAMVEQTYRLYFGD